MIERLLKSIFELLILLVVISFAMGLAVELLRAGAHVAAAMVDGVLPHLLSSLCATLFLGLLCIGLAARAVRSVSRMDPRAARERATRGRAVRQRARRPAEDVPVDEPEVPLDPDPALFDDEDEE